MIYVDIDFESRSTVDIKKSGLAKYARSSETEVLCFVISTGNEAIVNDLATLKWLAEDPEVIFRAHNSPFEMQIMEHKFGLKVPPHRWRCSMALARSYGLPASLGGCGLALGLDKQKDEEGRRNMMELCKPLGKNRKVQSHGLRAANTLHFNWHDDKYLMDVERYDALVSYCVDDVLSEEAIFEKLGELIPSEQKLWERDYIINYENGIKVDTELCEKAVEIFDVKCEEINVKCKEKHGFSLRQAKEVAGFLGLPDVRKETLRDADPSVFTPEQCEVLESRKLVSNTSPKKYQAALNAEVDGKLYGTLAFHGAERTGRWAGRLFQTQNIPRGSFSDLWVDEEMEISVRYIKEGRIEELPRPWIDTLKSTIRGVITGPIGVCDYSAIEARVVAWLAGEENTLEDFRQGKDLYKSTASGMFNIPYDAVTKDLRQLGKIASLSCGFQGSKGAFLNMANMYGLVMSEEEALNIVRKWRKANPNVVRAWYQYEADAIEAITTGDRAGRFEVIGDFLHMHLPSGRSIKYYKPELIHDDKFDKMVVTYLASPTQSDKIVEKIHSGWARVSTYSGRLFQNCTQSVARDLIADAIMKLPADAICMTVHDEINSQTLSSESLQEAMLDTPSWAKGIPIAADHFTAPRYRK